MKASVVILALLLLSKPFGLAQGFVNLNFEQAQITNLNGNEIPAANAFPGWTASANILGYNDISLSGGSISIMDTNGHAFTPLTIEGKYFAWFVGSDPNSPFAVSSISLGQTGQVPVAAKSILFWAVNQGGMQVTFNGFILNFSAISSTANYTVYGADISAYAGQVGLLIFSAPPGAGGKLDNIQFSTAVITPEPSSLALVALGSLLLARRHRQNS